MILIDSHCHLDDEKLFVDLDNVLTRGRAEGIKIFQTISTKFSNFEEILAIANNYSDVFCSVGVHPNEVASEGIISIADLMKHTLNPKVIGIGETGLDFYSEYRGDKNAQIESFRNHIKVASDSGLPIVIHTREADKDLIEVLEEEMRNNPFKGLIHCFTSTRELAKAVLDLGLYISISGIVTFKNASQLQDIVKFIPLDKLIIETDAPWLAPMPFRGKVNEPSYIKHTASFIADLKEMCAEELALVTSRNFLKLFDKVDFKL